MQFGLLSGCLHPETGERVAFRLDARFSEVRTRGPRSVVADVKTVAEVVASPHRIFKGLRRDGMGDGYALVGKPTTRFDFGPDGDLVSIDLPEKVLFLVYLNNQLCIFDFGWIDLDFDCPGMDATEAEDRYLTMCFDKELANGRNP